MDASQERPSSDPRRAREPDLSGTVASDGVRIAYDVWSPGKSATVLLMPTWSILHSRFWKLQVPWLARHVRVVAFDGRGSGRSDRPTGAAAYAEELYAEDAAAVLAAASVERATVVGLSCGVSYGLHLAAGHPGLVASLIAIGPSCGFGMNHPGREAYAWAADHGTTRGWAKYNRRYWLEGDYDDFLRFFFARMFSEPHSTKQVEDCVRWGREIDPATLVDTTAARLGHDGVSCLPADELCARVSCPVTVVHGTEDEIRPHAAGARLAELTGGTLVSIEGGGHGTQARDPVLLNRLVLDVVRRTQPTADPPRTWTRALRRPKRALFLSSPIGLGHARRDLAIARELRTHHPDLQVDWLAQDPVTLLLAASGETIHPASAWLASESAHVEDECADHDLHAFEAIRRMDEVLVNNFGVFHDVVEEQHYDLVVADEAWEVDHFLHENPELKHFAYAWLTDFVGWLPMPDGGVREAALTADHNAEMLEQRARFRRLRDRSVFVGNPDDVVGERFGPGLPRIDEWTRDHFDFAGYVTGFDPPTPEQQAALRRRLGYRDDELLCVVTVGGSGVGEALLRRVLDAVPHARGLVPELRFLVVTGPRIDPRSLPRPRGVTVRGYVPDLFAHLAACDVAVVQGGLTTCMELASARRPFLYVPLRHHFEQNLHVRHRLANYEAGTCVPYEDACDPELLAVTLAKEVRRETAYRLVETDGAARAAALLADLL